MADFLQVVEANRIGFSRELGVASVEAIREHPAGYGGPQPPTLTHAGIDDMFVERGSVAWYWHRGHLILPHNSVQRRAELRRSWVAFSAAVPSASRSRRVFFRNPVAHLSSGGVS